MQSNTGKRVAKNTILLYIRMIFLIILQLYTVPILLKNLGVEDYGIYNVVGGVVTIFAFLSSSLASGAQRFFSFELGKGDMTQLRKIFSATLTIYICIALIIIILLETIGVWFLNNKMTIPEDRLIAANWVFQFTLMTFLVNVISIPYNAVIIAREKMSVFAYLGIIDMVLKFFAAISLSFIKYDQLIFYSILIFVISLLMRFTYQYYCFIKFDECKYKWTWNQSIIKPLLVYSGFNMIGSLALISRQQGLNIILNLFFGVIINAAHSLGQQIYGVINQFINNIYTATRPVITKMYAQHQYNDMWNLVYKSAKLASYLLLLLMIPLLIEIEYVLKLWLGNPPQYTAIIIRFFIISLFIETLTNQIIAVFQAANKIKSYQLYSSVIILFTLPITYISLLIKTYILIPYFVLLTLSIIYIISLLIIGKKVIQLNIRYYLKLVIIPVLTVSFLSSIIPICLSFFWEESILRLVAITVVSFFSTSLVIYFIGINEKERSSLIRIINKKIR